MLQQNVPSQTLDWTGEPRRVSDHFQTTGKCGELPWPLATGNRFASLVASCFITIIILLYECLSCFWNPADVPRTQGSAGFCSLVAIFHSLCIQPLQTSGNHVTFQHLSVFFSGPFFGPSTCKCCWIHFYVFLKHGIKTIAGLINLFWRRFESGLRTQIYRWAEGT